jgi:hypothetical protein
MKAPRGAPKPARREIFVFTPEEKRAICFVLVAFTLGLATKWHRDHHPITPAKPMTAARKLTAPKPSPTARAEIQARPHPKL